MSKSKEKEMVKIPKKVVDYVLNELKEIREELARRKP
jgi:hypothetical protein